MRDDDDDFTVTGDELDRCLDRAERAEAEVARLRKALEDIASVNDYSMAVSLACAALALDRTRP